MLCSRIFTPLFCSFSSFVLPLKVHFAVNYVNYHSQNCAKTRNQNTKFIFAHCENKIKARLGFIRGELFVLLHYYQIGSFVILIICVRDQ